MPCLAVDVRAVGKSDKIGPFRFMVNIDGQGAESDWRRFRQVKMDVSRRATLRTHRFHMLKPAIPQSSALKRVRIGRGIDNGRDHAGERPAMWLESWSLLNVTRLADFSSFTFWSPLHDPISCLLLHPPP